MRNPQKSSKVLFYDIETSPLQAWIWRPGQQYVSPDQLVEGYDEYGIICITYCWNDGKPAKSINWGLHKQDSGSVVERFDKIVKKAEIIIGKNSDRFDVKHVNTQRMLAGLPPMPEWMLIKDDLETQLRKHFYVPSQGLDYWSKLLGLGGKDKMIRADWIDIVQNRSRKALDKMEKYGCKDTEDTRAIWNRVYYYIKPRHNRATIHDGRACYYCESENIKPNGPRPGGPGGKTMYQQWRCVDGTKAGTHTYAGRSTISKTGKLGKIG